MRRTFVLLILTLVLATAAFAAFVEEGDTGGQSRPAPIPIPPPWPPDSCGTQPALRDMAFGVEVGRPSRRLGVEIYPVRRSNWRGDGDVRAAGDALSDGDLEVREQGAGSVPWVSVRNSSRKPVLLAAGEILAGGKQNRIVANDFLVPPHSDWTDVPVFCGERSRWSGTGDAGFKESGQMAPAAMRDQLARGTDQQEVWSEASKTLAGAGAANPTENLGDVYKKGGTAEALRCFHHGGWADFPSDTVGMVVMSRGGVLGIEVFPNPRVFRTNWRKVLDSILANQPWPQIRCGEKMPPGDYFYSTQRTAEEALRALAGASVHGGFPAGMGCGSRLWSGGMRGQAVTHEGMLIHAAVIGGLIARPPYDPLIEKSR